MSNKNVSIGSSDGLALLNKQQAIIWSNEDLFLICFHARPASMG